MVRFREKKNIMDSPTKKKIVEKVVGSILGEDSNDTGDSGGNYTIPDYRTLPIFQIFGLYLKFVAIFFRKNRQKG
mgnify:CR=1 FL=1